MMWLLKVINFFFYEIKIAKSQNQGKSDYIICEQFLTAATVMIKHVFWAWSNICLD